MPAPHSARPDLYGAQPERTALAWQRSLLSVQLGSVLLTLTAVREQAWVLVILGAGLTTAVGWWLLVRGPARQSVARPRHEGDSSGRPGPAGGLLRLVVAVSLLGTLGVTLALSRAFGAL
ncbi:hypothetical protein [Sanguibacter inulinus]|jgi:hypothetical protein|uniref:DUF202 domain-containing protein n=1 Tax=Sanguibacter inulinus TaxID=60922 RepID=A0A853EVL3_9MICO|nr:hypothetical protein [Sanguibacter inulinus]MBF0723444.1 hypothetical protein [Sanguibacter inulinus]NYS94589.1 hypothetical protein [Sanguibacter inulinus]